MKTMVVQRIPLGQIEQFPNHTSPNHTNPNHTDPNHTGPNKKSPNHTSPNKKSPTKSSTKSTPKSLLKSQTNRPLIKTPDSIKAEKAIRDANALIINMKKQKNKNPDTINPNTKMDTKMDTLYEVSPFDKPNNDMFYELVDINVLYNGDVSIDIKTKQIFYVLIKSLTTIFLGSLTKNKTTREREKFDNKKSESIRWDKLSDVDKKNHKSDIPIWITQLTNKIFYDFITGGFLDQINKLKYEEAKVFVIGSRGSGCLNGEYDVQISLNILHINLDIIMKYIVIFKNIINLKYKEHYIYINKKYEENSSDFKILPDEKTGDYFRLFNKNNDAYLTKGDGYYFELYVMIHDKNGNRKKFTILDCVLCGRQSSHYFNSLINTDKVIPH